MSELASRAGDGNTSETNTDPIPVDIPVDPGAKLSVYARNATTKQGGSLFFKIELNKASTVPVTANVETVAGTAVEDTDFAALSTAIVIPAGQTSVTVAVPTLLYNNALSVSTKTVNLSIKTTSAGTIIQKIGSGTILAYQKELTEKVRQIENQCLLLLNGNVSCLSQGVLTPMPGLVGVKQLLAAGDHYCVITAQDTVKCWGSNFYGQLGNGVTTDSPTVPVDVVGLTSVYQITGNYYRTCALHFNGQVSCWGMGASVVIVGSSYVQGANDERTPFATPVRLPLPVLFKKIVVDERSNCGIVSPGDHALCWRGSQFSNETPNPESAIPGVVGIGLVQGSVLVITNQNLVYGVGIGISSYLPAGSNYTRMTQMPQLNGARQFSAGSRGAWCVVTTTNTVKCFYVGTTTNDIPITNVKSVSGNCAILADDTIKCWGERSDAGVYARLKMTADIRGRTNLVQASGGRTTCGVERSGAVRCWGNNSLGQAGNGTFATSAKGTSTLVKDLANARKVAMGLSHGCALTTAGTVKCWGLNDVGQLGNNSLVNSNVPVDVVGITNAVDVAAFGKVSCAVLQTGSAKCWGDNSNGALGTGVNLSSSVPQDVAGVTNIKSLTLGDMSACATDTAGAVKCWGSNNAGQLGATLTSPVVATTVVPTLAGMKQISLSTTHGCGITAQNTVKCWGANTYRQLGVAGAIPVGTLVDVPGVPEGALQVLATPGYSCAITTERKIKCWGQLGFEGYGGYPRQTGQEPVSDTVLVAGFEGTEAQELLLPTSTNVNSPFQVLLTDGRVRDNYDKFGYAIYPNYGTTPSALRVDN